MRCAVLGALAPALAIAIRIARMKRDCWLVVSDRQEADRIQEEGERRILCTVNASYAVRRADLIILADGVLPSITRPEPEECSTLQSTFHLHPTASSLIAWLDTKLRPEQMLLLCAHVEPGTTSLLRSSLHAEVAFMASSAFHRPMPILLGTKDGQAVPMLVTWFQGMRRELCWQSDYDAEMLQDYAATALQGGSGLDKGMSQTSRQKWHQLQAKYGPFGVKTECYGDWRYS